MIGKWWENDPKLLIKEIDNLEKLSLEESRFKFDKPKFSADEVVISGSLIDGENEKKFLLTYPSLFPYVCPSVKPQQKEHWSSHQYGEGGTLCLEIGPDNWDQNKYCGRDLVESLKRLIDGESSEETKKNIPSRHTETLGQKLRFSFYRFVPPEQNVLESNTAKFGDCVISSNLQSESLTLWLEEFPKGTSLPVQHGLKHGKSFDRTCKFFVIGKMYEGFRPNHLSVLELTKIVVSNQLGEEAAKALEGTTDGTFLLFLVEGHAPIVLRASIAETQLRLKLVPSAEIEHKVRIDPKVQEAFEKQKIAIIGLGSVGSKVAVSLARIGVRDFVFVDDEVLEFGNIVRHEATMADVSTHKVDMVADLIHHICPVEPIIKKETIRIGGQENPARHAEVVKEILSADLVIDCTASGEVFQFLAAVCSIHEKALVWGEVFAGGIGGIVSYANPITTPSPLVVKKSLNDYLEVQPEAPYKLETERYQGGPLVADDNSVAIIASMIVFKVKQIILNTEESPSPCWLVGMTKTWIFEFPFEVKYVPCRPEDYPEVPNWGRRPEESVLSPEETTRYKEILSYRYNEHFKCKLI